MNTFFEVKIILEEAFGEIYPFLWVAFLLQIINDDAISVLNWIIFKYIPKVMLGKHDCLFQEFRGGKLVSERLFVVKIWFSSTFMSELEFFIVLLLMVYVKIIVSFI